ncbi:WD40/YVTN/BNR-like repeat-containing protein [Polyangium jinanense]|uniref:Photosynthesis system II assembly factor Ycf48/Hcf136-like domain-containing protein n=1 Tax=Polyangium jinanense TaxID=2829994 RepID=A0A9X3XB13_9BACT|nr:hypothetical protein [Polyangium jinanense]MDC3959284.1 hypothetical protein [Polyangium jinanense]MDC3985693.1 hypothetical protein [Polyangium jinanense]
MLAGKCAFIGIVLSTVSLSSCLPVHREYEDGLSIGPKRALCAPGLVRRDDTCEEPLWAEIAPLPANALRMRDVVDVDGHEAWIVGHGGLVLHSNDGGESFERVDVGTSEDLSFVWADEQAIVLTAARRAWVSLDEGRTFEPSPEAPEELSRCVLFFGRVVCGSAQGGLYHGKIGDAAIANVPLGGRTAVAVGPGYLVAATESGGTTIRIRATEEPDLHAFYGDTQIPGGTTGTVDSLWVSRQELLACVVGDDASYPSGLALHCSTTRGNTFERRGSLAPECARGPQIAGDSSSLHVMTHCNTLDMPTTFEVWTSRDEGQTFTRGTWGAEFESSWRGANRVSFGTANHGLLLTHRLRRSTDGAKSSEPIEQNAMSADWAGGMNENKAVFFPTKARGYVIAMQNTTAVFNFRLYRTDDAFHFDDGTDLPAFTDDSTRPPSLSAHEDLLWLAFPSEYVQQTFLRSEDGGRTFLHDGFPAQGQPLAAAVLGPGGLGFVATARGAVNARPLYRSKDGGATFSELSLPDGTYIRDLEMLESGRLVGVGENGLILTSDDAGETFVVCRGGMPDEEQLVSVTFAPGTSVGWAGGVTSTGEPLLLRTEDGGTTWVAQTLGVSSASIVQVAAATPKRASVVLEMQGVRSLVMTHDGGQSWSPRETPGDDPLRMVARLPDGETTFALGAYGLYRSRTP